MGSRREFMKQKLTAASWFCFSILYLAGGWGLSAGTMRKPGPGLLPRMVGIGLLVLTGIHLWQTLRKSEEPQSSSGPFNPGNVLGVATAILVYPVLLYYLKFILATFAVVYFMLLFLKFKGPVWDFIIALGLVVLSFLVFAMVLGVSLVSGPIEEFFFRLRG